MNQIESKKNTVRRLLDKVVNAGDMEMLPNLIVPDCVKTDGGVRIVSGVSTAERRTCSRPSWRLGP